MIIRRLMDLINIRKATATDLPTMLLIMDAALGVPSDPEEMDERTMRWQLKLNNESEFIFYVAESSDGQVIGWCRAGRALECRRLVMNEIYECEIHNIFILPQYQRRGVGRQLWNRMWNEIMDRFHPKNVVVWSTDKVETQQFYRSLGGQEREQKRFDDDCILTAFTWDSLHQ